MKMVVHIERLVLDGVALTPAEQQRLGPAIEAALGEQLAGHAWPGNKLPASSAIREAPARHADVAYRSVGGLCDGTGAAIASAIVATVQR